MNQKFKLKFYIAQAGLTQASLAKKCNLSTTAISRVINGKLESYPAKVKIAKVLKKPFSELWG